MKKQMDKPLAAAGLTSYRYRGSLGWIAIGAKDDAEAFLEAARSTSERLQPERLEVWNSAGQMYVPALKPVFETGNDTTGFYAKVLELNSCFKVVAYDADGDIRSGLCLWASDLPTAKAYAEQFWSGNQKYPAPPTSQVKKRCQQREWLQDYRNRDYVQSKLDDAVFEAFVGEDFTLACMTTGCLDALDNLPAGSVQVTVEPYYDQRMACRGKTQAELDDLIALATGLIEDVKAQEEVTRLVTANVL